MLYTKIAQSTSKCVDGHRELSPFIALFVCMCHSSVCYTKVFYTKIAQSTPKRDDRLRKSTPFVASSVAISYKG